MQPNYSRADLSSVLARTRPLTLALAPKFAGGGTHRTVSARAAWNRVRPQLGRIGVTRVADITGLDRLGVPTWSCVRPLADRFSVSVTCGKGMRAIDAAVGAAMEAVEYYSAEPNGARLVTARADDLGGDFVDPFSLNVPSWASGAGALPLAWVPGWDLTRQAPAWVPANAVFFPFEDQPGAFLFTPTTNGLAAGMCLEEAVCHALAELIERDAWSLACARAWYPPGLGGFPLLDVRSVPPSITPLVRRFEERGVQLLVHSITSDVGIAAFHASTLEAPGPSMLLAHEGMGAHPDAEIALQRALTEVAQSRAADIQGGREDLTFWRARGGASTIDAEWWRGGAPVVHFADVPSRQARDVLADIEWMISCLHTIGLNRIICVDLTRREVGLPVVRVVVPGLEVTCVDPWRLGPRVRAQLLRDRVTLPGITAPFPATADAGGRGDA